MVKQVLWFTRRHIFKASRGRDTAALNFRYAHAQATGCERQHVGTVVSVSGSRPFRHAVTSSKFHAIASTIPVSHGSSEFRLLSFNKFETILQKSKTWKLNPKILEEIIKILWRGWRNISYIITILSSQRHAVTFQDCYTNHHRAHLSISWLQYMGPVDRPNRQNHRRYISRNWIDRTIEQWRMIRLNAKVFVIGSPGVIKSIRPSALLLGPLISVYGATLYMSRAGRSQFRPRSCHRDQLCQVCSRFTDKIITLKDPHLSRSGTQTLCDRNESFGSSTGSSYLLVVWTFIFLELYLIM